MSGNNDGLRSLAKYSNLPVERIDYRADADAKVLASMDRGVLFLMAFWSGSSIMAFKQLSEVICRLDAAGKLEFIVADVDGSPTLYDVPGFLSKVHGHGEVAWIRSGKIVATSGLGPNADCYERNTTSLLSLP